MKLKIAVVFVTVLSTSYCSVALGRFEDLSGDAKPLPTTTLGPKTTVTVPPTTASTTTAAPTTTTPKPETTTIPTTTTVDPKPKTTTTTTTTAPDPKTTTTTTPDPKTTTPTTTTTTPDPKTTTTTTPDPKTTTPTTTTTTAGPKTTTIGPVTTTVPPPPATAGTWIVQNKNVTCVIAKLIIQANITYPTNNGTKHYIIASHSSTDNATVVEGSCGNVSQAITIPLGDGHSITLGFKANETAKQYDVDKTELLVNVSALPEIKDNVTGLHYLIASPIFETPLTKSYKCNRVQNFNMTNEANETVAVLTLKDVQLEAFHQDGVVKFGDAQDCDAGNTPDIVPIAVGVSLGVMILIVLVAYLVGRRRNPNGGYVSIGP